MLCSFNGILFSNKKNKVLIHVTERMNFESIMLSEKKLVTEGLYMVWFHVYELSWLELSIGIERRFSRSIKKRESEVSANGCGIYFGGDKNVQELDHCDRFTTLWNTKNIEFYILKRWILWYISNF